jgi:SEC-C motif-containing protein
MTDCPCGTGQPFESCCGPILDGAAAAETAEAAMRARYTAFTRADVDFLMKTIHSSKRDQHDPKAIAKWATGAEWLGLDILNTTGGGPGDETGDVEFKARFREKGKRQEHHELATFSRESDTWVFVDGTAPQIRQVVRESPKVGRNDPCPCNSGRKYKKCCGK